MNFTRTDVFTVLCVWALFSTSSAAYAQVNEAWVARHGEIKDLHDSAKGLALDSDGSIYVTGISDDNGNSDYATVKYSSEGEELWVRRYDGPSSTWDSPAAMALDRVGNVYVTGDSGGAYATVKYSSEGEELWVARLERIGRGPASALALDRDGNAYVTGSRGTVKYDSEGNELWLNLRGGSSLTLDSEGNVYVLGSPSLVNYDSEGNELWVVRPGGRALALDGDGNVYVTGSSQDDYATRKYSPEAEELWVALYDGPDGRDDRPSAIAFDSAGSVYVTGGTDIVGAEFGVFVGGYATVKYSALGEKLWVARYDLGVFLSSPSLLPSDLALDADGNIYVTGVSQDGDHSTLKYSPAGEESWVVRYRHSSSDGGGFANALAIDLEGNICVTGTIDLYNRQGEYATVKYSPEGEEFWAARYDGPGDRNMGKDWPTGLAVDGDGNVFVTGGFEDYCYFDGPGEVCRFDYGTVKYSPEGEELWATRYEDDGSAGALAVGSNGNVYVLGSPSLVKYDSEGNELWAVRPGGSALALDGDGNVYVTGSSHDDYATMKYSPEAEELWIARYDGPDGGSDSASALALDGEGNVYVTGASQGDYATVKYSTDGEELWVARYDGGSAIAVAVGSDGDVYVTGSSATVKYDADGNELWVVEGGGRALAVDGEGDVYVTTFASGTVKYDAEGKVLWVAPILGSTLTLDREGNVYVIGSSQGGFVTVKYNLRGEELWVVHYDGSLRWDYLPNTLMVDSEGNVYVTGSSGGDYATVKYSQGVPILPSDGNADGALDISDGISLLGHLFVGEPPSLPCGDGTVSHAANRRLVDSNGDDAVDLSDGIYVFSYLFLGGPPPVLGTECVAIAGCPSTCAE